MEKAFNYRFYPTREQESLLRRTLGCVRLVYNKALQERTQAWHERQEKVSYGQTSFLTLIILAAGLAVSVCGASVRPESSKSAKATAMKQKPKL